MEGESNRFALVPGAGESYPLSADVRLTEDGSAGLLPGADRMGETAYWVGLDLSAQTAVLKGSDGTDVSVPFPTEAGTVYTLKAEMFGGQPIFSVEDTPVFTQALHLAGRDSGYG